MAAPRLLREEESKKKADKECGGRREEVHEDFGARRERRSRSAVAEKRGSRRER